MKILFEEDKKEEFNPIGENYKKEKTFISTLKESEDEEEEKIVNTDNKKYLTVTEISKHFKIQASILDIVQN